MKKRFLAFFLAFVMVLGIVPVTVFASSAGENWTITVEKYDADGNGTYLLEPTVVNYNYYKDWVPGILNYYWGNNYSKVEYDSHRNEYYITKIVDSSQEDGWLDNGDLGENSHWKIVWNGTVLADKPSGCYASRGAVIRYIFSVDGDAAEAGVDKNGLIQYLAGLTAVEKQAAGDAYDKANAVVLDPNATAAEVAAAQAALEALLTTPATGITLTVNGETVNTLTLDPEQTATVTAVLTPANATDTVTWSVENPAVATVDQNGLVTAVAAGSTVLTAKANDTVSAEISITVNYIDPSTQPYVYFEYADGTVQQMAADGSFTLGSLDQGYFRVGNTADTAWWENEETIDAGFGSVAYHWYVNRETGQWQPSGQQPTKPITVTAGSFTKSFTINYEATSGVTELKTYINGTEVTDDAPYEVTGCVSGIAVTTKGLKDGAWIDIPVQALSYDTSDNVYYNFRFVGNELVIDRAGSATMTVSLKGERVSTTFKAVCNEVLATAMRVVVPETAEIGDWDAVPNQYVGLRPFTGFDIEFTPANATNRDVTWTALTPDIAEYSDLHSAGIVPKKAGTAKFTVTNTADPSLTQEVEVTFVYKNPLTAAASDAASYTLDVGETKALTVSVTPENATEQRFTWTYSQDGIVEVTDNIKTSENGLTAWTVHSIKALKAGTVTVTGTPWDTTGGCGNVTFTVTVEGDTPPTVVSADWPSFRGNDYNNGITAAETPRTAAETGLKWAVTYSASWSDAPSPMILVDNTLVTMSGSTLKKLSLSDGSVLASTDMTAASGWGTIPPTYADGYIFCPLDGGRVEAFNAETLESLWVYTDANGGQPQCPIAYADGKLYVGFYDYSPTAFVCLDASDGSLIWRDYDGGNSFYWAGAAVVGDYAVYGGDSGTVVSRNKNTGDLVSTLNVGAAIHASICYEGGRIYLMANNAQLCRADLNAETGALNNLVTVDCSAYGSASTSTPTVYNGIVYVGVGGWSGGSSVVAVDADTMEVLWHIDEPAYPQCSVLLSTAYVDSGYVYLYVTYNNNPGGVNVIKARIDGSEATQETLFNASGYENYCICSVIAGSDGTLYYKNDSNYIFALRKVQSQTDADVENVISLIDAIGTVTLESGDAITAARTAYDALTGAQQAQVTNYSVLTAAEAALAALKQPAPSQTIEVSLTVLGDSAHGEGGDTHTLVGNNLEVWVAENTYAVAADATVWDLVKLVLDENEITYSNPTGSYLVSLTKDGVTLGELTNGANSGWMYTLNGKHPNQGMSQQTLADGDAVVLHYTDDYTQEHSRIQVTVTIANAGEVVMAMESVTVNDLNDDGKFDVDEVLYAAHEAGFEGGAAAGYGSAVGSYGLSLTKLWGDESGAFGYWLNNASCWSLADEVQSGDYVVAFVYQDQTYWADAYAKFDKLTYTAAGELTVALEKAGYDENWNTVFSALSGAVITAYNADGSALAAEQYAVTDNGDGTYTVTFDGSGAYTLIATENTTPIVPAVSKVSVTITPKDTDPEKIYRETGDLLAGQDASKFVYGAEWAVLGLARSGRAVPAGYYDSVCAYVEENIDANGRLSSTKSTENSRLILALTALGYDVTDVGGHNLLSGLNSMSYLKKQGINGPIWALIAFDSHSYEIPAGDVTREALIDAILAAQLPNGGWSFSGTQADSDMTGMALQALAPYYESSNAVKAAVDKTLETLSNMQLADGSFYTFETDGSTYASAESTAQVVAALTALGINPETDARFVKNGCSALDALCGYAIDGGGFRHVADGEMDGMATEQGYYALAAYFRFLGGKTSLYDMRDVTIKSNAPDVPDPTEPSAPTDSTNPSGSTETPKTGDEFPVMLLSGLMAACLLTAAALLLASKKKKFDNR